MAGQENAGTARRTRPAPAIVTPLTKVNLALPFSKITIEEPGKDLAELASVVAALAAVMERTADEPFLPELRKRAEALAARLPLRRRRCDMTFIEGEITIARPGRRRYSTSRPTSGTSRGTTRGWSARRRSPAARSGRGRCSARPCGPRGGPPRCAPS